MHRSIVKSLRTIWFKIYSCATQNACIAHITTVLLYYGPIPSSPYTSVHKFNKPFPRIWRRKSPRVAKVKVPSEPTHPPISLSKTHPNPPLPFPQYHILSRQPPTSGHSLRSEDGPLRSTPAFKSLPTSQRRSHHEIKEKPR